MSELTRGRCFPGLAQDCCLLQNYSRALMAADIWAMWLVTSPSPILQEGWLARGLEGQRCGSDISTQLGFAPSLPRSSCMRRVPAGPAGQVAPLEFAEWEQQLLSPLCKVMVHGFATLWFRCCFSKRGASGPATGRGTRTLHCSQSRGAAGPAAARLGSQEPRLSGTTAASAQNADVMAEIHRS